MMSVKSLINGLEAWVQEELLSRRRMLTLLEEQETTVKRGRGGQLEGTIAAIEAELEAQARRDERRVRLFAGLAEQWGVAADALTLTSICERAGADAGRLANSSAELARACEEIVNKNRRLAALLQAHHRVVVDLLEALIAIQGGEPGRRQGALVDAEA